MSFLPAFQTSGTVPRILAGIGLATSLTLAARLLSFAWLYFGRRSSLPRYLAPGAYALVTGASDGIGRALAHALAARGFNVVLHGRNADKLARVAADIRGAHAGRTVRVVVADAAASHGMKAAIEGIADGLRRDLDGPLTVLVNNAGGTQMLRESYTELRRMDAAEVDGMINLNARFHVQLTRALLPLLEGERGAAPGGAERRRALIMYTGSLAGVVPAPWLSTYSPAKMFGSAWIASLAREMRETNPDVEALGVLVGKVTDTAFFKSAPTFFVPDSNTMAAAMLDRVGCGKLNVVGYWAHAVQSAFFMVLPESWQTLAISSTMKNEREIYAEMKRQK